MSTSDKVSVAAVFQEPGDRARLSMASNGECIEPGVGTKRSFDRISEEEISDAEIWTEEFWRRIFERLSDDMKQDFFMAKAILPFITMIKNEIRQAYSDHFERPTLESYENFAEKHAFVKILCREIALQESKRHITRAQAVEMQQILEYDFD